MSNAYSGIFARSQSDELIDISKRRIIIWPAGEYAKKWVSKIQLNEVYKVLDSSINKIGKKIFLLNNEYTIERVDLLNSLDPDSNVILIASDNHNKDIRGIIAERYPNWSKNSYDIENVLYSYNNLLNAICFDYENAEKVFRLNISSFIPYYINKTNDLLKRICYVQKNDILTWIPLSGERISFRLIIRKHNRNDQDIKKYVIHFPMHTLSYINNRNTLSSVYATKKFLGINTNLTVYEDTEGFQIDHCGDENVEFNKENLDYIIKQIRELHNSGAIIDIERDRVKEIDNYVDKALKNEIRSDLSIQVISGLSHDAHIYLNSNKRVISHGDLWPNNIIRYEGKIEVIDWMTMSMADPMYDICKFYCRTYIDYNLQNYSLSDALTIYYNRKPDDSEYKYAELMVRYIALDFYLKQLNKGYLISDKLIDLISGCRI